MRTFIALSLPQDTQDALGDIAARMASQDKGGTVRWVAPHDFHLTLAFLGEHRGDQIERLAEHMDDEVVSYGVESMISSLEPFPANKPKLFAAIVEPSDTLLDIKHQVNKSISAAGIYLPRTRFNPHITLGRFKSGRANYAGSIPIIQSAPLDCHSLVIYQSFLSPQGAQYQPLYEWPLGFDYASELTLDELT